MTRAPHDQHRRLAADLKRRLGGKTRSIDDDSSPIAFQVEWVRAILGGFKTQTRRPLARVRMASFEQGRRLWVREKWGRAGGQFVHAADGERADVRYYGGQSMPRAAARLMLEVHSCRVEPLHTITDEDARAEGAPRSVALQDARRWFESIWRSIYAQGEARWEANPAVLVISFTLVELR